MEVRAVAETRPNLKTRGFSTLHIDIFIMILVGKTNREINQIMGYTMRSHVVVDHSRKVMCKLLGMEGLNKREYTDRIVWPRDYKFWWEKLLDKHIQALFSIAKPAVFYDEMRSV